MRENSRNQRRRGKIFIDLLPEAYKRESRIKKKLLGRQTWYLDKEKSNAKLGKNSFKKSVKRKLKNKFERDSSPKTVTVMFVFQTPNGELAKRLQSVENDIAKITGKRVKIVERSGTMMRRLLHKSNPWAGAKCGGAKCGRDNCLSCLNLSLIHI